MDLLKHLILILILIFHSCSTSLPAQVISIDSAFVHLETNPDSLFVSGAMTNLFIERVQTTALGDNYNTQQVEIFFGGCETQLVYKPYHTYVALNATFPYRVKIYVYVDTTSICSNLSEPMLSDSLIITAEEIIGIDELDADDLKLKIYPNPSKGVFHLEFPDEIKIRRAVLVSQEGRELEKVDLDEKTLSLEDYSKGLYYLYIETAKSVLTRKIILR